MKNWKCSLLSLASVFLFQPFVAAENQSEDQTTYFLGEVKMSSPTGSPYGSSVSLVKRIVSKANSKITEYVLSVEANDKATEYVTVFDITGSNFKIHDDLGTFSGEGQLTGKEWEWSGWKYSVQMNNGSGSLTGEDTLSAAGLVVKKTFSGPDGKARVLFNEELKPISQPMYDILKAKLTSAK